jgi:hypothetical protein
LPKPAFPALPRVAWVGRFGEGWNSGFQGTAKPLFQASLEPPEYPLRRARNRGFQDPGIGLPGQVSRVLGSGSWDPGKPSPGLPQGFPRASPGPWKPRKPRFSLNRVLAQTGKQGKSSRISLMLVRSSFGLQRIRRESAVFLGKSVLGVLGLPRASPAGS